MSNLTVVPAETQKPVNSPSRQQLSQAVMDTEVGRVLRNLPVGQEITITETNTRTIRKTQVVTPEQKRGDSHGVSIQSQILIVGALIVALVLILVAR